jgi:hypothetical protein
MLFSGLLCAVKQNECHKMCSSVNYEKNYSNLLLSTKTLAWSNNVERKELGLFNDSHCQTYILYNND